MINKFEEMLTGGHPNSLGNTIEVVNIIFKDKSKLNDLYEYYFSKDEVVRLRVSNAMKRICKEKPEWLSPYLDKLLNEISQINQASTQWTLSQLFLWLEKDMTNSQKQKAIEIMQTNLLNSKDWIVQNTTIETLGLWSIKDGKLKKWLIPRLEKFTNDTKKSVANRAKKMLMKLSE